MNVKCTKENTSILVAENEFIAEERPLQVQRSGRGMLTSKRSINAGRAECNSTRLAREVVRYFKASFFEVLRRRGIFAKMKARNELKFSRYMSSRSKPRETDEVLL